MDILTPLLTPALKESLELGYTVDNKYGNSHTVSIGLCYLNNNSDSYWSLNTLEQNPKLKIMFKNHLKDINKYKLLHLADTKGAPMYTVDNGYYYYELAMSAFNGDISLSECSKTVDTLASHLRITSEVVITQINRGMNKEQFEELCDSYRPRWQQESNELYTLLTNLKHLSKI